MKSATTDMKALLASGAPLLFADLYTFTLASGTVLRYTTFDMPLAFSGHTWLHDGPLVFRGSIRQALGIQVQTVSLTVVPKATDLIAGLTWPVAARRGAFEGCHVLIERTAMPIDAPGDTSRGKYWKFSGDVGEVSADRMVLDMDVVSGESVFNRVIPIHRHQPSCRNTLFDARCGLAAGSFETPATVTSGTTASEIHCGLTDAAAYFTGGVVEIASGDQAGQRRTVKQYTPGVFRLMSPLLAAPAPGDTFLAWPGCDRTLATCGDKFSNTVNFRGEPFIPQPETAL